MTIVLEVGAVVAVGAKVGGKSGRRRAGKRGCSIGSQASSAWLHTADICGINDRLPIIILVLSDGLPCNIGMARCTPHLETSMPHAAAEEMKGF